MSYIVSTLVISDYCFQNPFSFTSFSSIAFCCVLKCFHRYKLSYLVMFHINIHKHLHIWHSRKTICVVSQKHKKTKHQIRKKLEANRNHQINCHFVWPKKRNNLLAMYRKTNIKCSLNCMEQI